MVKRALVLVATLLMAGLLVAPATAQPVAPAQTCPIVIRFVCLAGPGGIAELIPEGEIRTYPNGLSVTGMSNGTRLHYCVVASPFSFGLPSGAQVSRPMTVRTVAPNVGACLA